MSFFDEKKIIDDQTHLWLGDYLNIISKNQSEIISPSSFFKKLLIIAKEIMKDFLVFISKNRNDVQLNGEILAFIETNNNFEALNFLSDSFPVVYGAPWKLNLKKDNLTQFKFNLRFKLFYDVKFPIFFTRLIIASNKNERKKYLKRVDIVYKSYGLVKEYKRILFTQKPKLIIFTNDHNVHSRGLLIAANDIGIPTIYIQHASISEYFPPLIFDLALLEGLDSMLKYESISNTNTKIELIGMPKFDRFINGVNKKRNVEKIGICYNLNDDLNDVLRVVDKIKKELPEVEIILRGHPNDYRLIEDKKLNISNSKVQNSFDFLAKVDLIVSGDSSIHLEATIMNVVSIYYNYSKNTKMDDYYGYVKNNLISKCTNSNDLLISLKEESIKKTDVQYRAKYYNDSIKSSYYGNSSKKAVQIIKAFSK